MSKILATLILSLASVAAFADASILATPVAVNEVYTTFGDEAGAAYAAEVAKTCNEVYASFGDEAGAACVAAFYK